MGRAARGSVFWEGGRWKARITLPNGQRRNVALPLGLSEDEARAEAQRMSALVRLQPVEVAEARAPTKEETVAEYIERLVAWKTVRGHVTARDTLGRLRKWVLPVIGPLPVAGFTRLDLERVVRHLDAAVVRGDISAKTAANVWGDVTNLCGQAHKSKSPELQVRADDPSRDVSPPDGGIEKSKPILFPDELLALLTCERVPVQRRRLYALAVYLAARANEIAALTAADFDLVHGTVTIERQRDRKTGADKPTKTKRIRVTDLEPALVPLVEQLVAERPRGRLLSVDDLPTDEERATSLRADLLTAGVARPALHLETPQRLPLWFHHLRDTGLTWMAVRGDDPLRIQWRGGHTDFKTTQRYISAGRLLAMGGAFRRSPPFPTIPACILPRQDSRQALFSSAETLRPQRDSKPFPRSGPSAAAGKRRVAHRVATAGDVSGVDSGVPARQLEPGEMHPRDAARLAREGLVAVAFRRCVIFAERGDRKGTLEAMEQTGQALRATGAS